MEKSWTSEDVLETARSYQPACVLAAAADLSLFEAIGSRDLSAGEVAQKLQGNLRATTILLDALAALQFLGKQNDRYSVPKSVGALLTRDGADSVLAMAQHQANCLRRWSEIARVVKSGRPAERTPSVRGEEGDRESFIGAMHAINVSVADELVRAIQPLAFRHLLDVGGASGTWTIAFLRAHASATATLFDLPPVIPLARLRLGEAGLKEKVRLVAGDFLVDPLPRGADLAWVSAIVHQNSREQNRSLFARVRDALVPGGRIAIRDIVMDPNRTGPVSGALFAVNMLVATEGGGTFTLDELREDLESAGFVEATLVRRDDGMNAVVAARKPGGA